MEHNYCVIKDIHPSNQMIENVPMTSNHLFPLSIRLYMKATSNQIVRERKNVNSKSAFKEENKEGDMHCV